MGKMERIKTGYDRMHDLFYSQRIKKFGGVRQVFWDRLETPWHRVAFKLLSSLTVKDRQVLEVGCGYGALSIALAQLGATVTGLDISKRALKIAKEMSEELNIKIGLFLGDAQNIPCSTGVFDIIVSCETLEHIPNLEKALAEISRCGKSRAYLLLTFPNVINPIGIYQRLASKQPFEKSLTLGLMRREIKKLGNLKIISVEPTYSFAFLQGVEHRLPKGLGSHIGLLVKKET